MCVTRPEKSAMERTTEWNEAINEGAPQPDVDAAGDPGQAG